MQGVESDLPLSGRRALVTGAAGGIGAATVRALRHAGAAVLGVDASPAFEGHVADVTDPNAMEAAVEVAGGLDICVANAGVSLMQPFSEGSLDDWERVVSINLLGVMTSFQAAARAMVAHGRGGRLIAVASVAGLRGEPDTSAYAASKAGVTGLVRALAVELAEHGIGAVAVAPGQIETAMNRRDLERLAARAGRPPEALLREHLERRVPARRMGTPEEVAELIAFLAGAEFVNGTVVTIDGGELAG